MNPIGINTTTFSQFNKSISSTPVTKPLPSTELHLEKNEEQKKSSETVKWIKFIVGVTALIAVIKWGIWNSVRDLIELNTKPPFLPKGRSVEELTELIPKSEEAERLLNANT